MLNVLLVSPNQERAPDPVPPIGAAYVADAARRAGHAVRIADACFDGPTFPGHLARELDELRPDVVGLSLRNVDNTTLFGTESYVPAYREVARVVREHAPRAKLVLGGSAFTLFPHALLEALGADHGIAGEGEAQFVALLDRLDGSAEQPPEGLLWGVPSDLGPRARPARDLVDLARYHREGGSTNLQTKRGCAFQCSYCSYPALEGARIRTRRPEDVVDEIEGVLREHGIDCFFFVDSVFNVPPDHAVGICDEIVRRNLEITWSAYLSPAAVTARLFESMARSGCRSVDFGTDAASPATLVALRKGFGVEDVRLASALCREHGIKFSHSLVLGGPGETWSTLDETVANVVATEPTAVVAVAGVRLHPGTELAARAIAEGQVAHGAIGLEPVFYVSEAVRDGLLDRLAGIGKRHRNWFIPGITPPVPEPLRARLRARGAEGPLWEQLSRGASR
ncbi:MAG: cobalamin B12-binding domain-containing protein [Deltaproteobacteria bacterium]|nr:cobalamin B12-binding domain-containing protein [Deltaproteobacteria bacterium]